VSFLAYKQHKDVTLTIRLNFNGTSFRSILLTWFHVVL